MKMENSSRLQAFVFALTAYPGFVHAAAWDSGFQWILDALTGTTATVVAGLALAYVGYQFFFGDADRRQLLLWLVGVILVFGAPLIVQEFTTGFRAS